MAYNVTEQHSSAGAEYILNTGYHEHILRQIQSSNGCPRINGVQLSSGWQQQLAGCLAAIVHLLSSPDTPSTGAVDPATSCAATW